MSVEKPYLIARSSAEVLALTGLHLLNTWTPSYSQTRDGRGLLFLPERNIPDEIIASMAMCEFSYVEVPAVALQEFLQLIDERLSIEERQVIQKMMIHLDSSHVSISIPISFTTATYLLTMKEQAARFVPDQTIVYWERVRTYCNSEDDLWVNIYDDFDLQAQVMLLNKQLALEAARVKDEEAIVSHEHRHYEQAELLAKQGIHINGVYDSIRRMARVLTDQRNQFNDRVKAEVWFNKLLRLEYEFSALKECDATISELQFSSDKASVSTFLSFMARTYRIHYSGFSFQKSLIPSSEIEEFVDVILGLKDIQRPARPTPHFLGMIVLLFGFTIFSEGSNNNFEISSVLGELEIQNRRELLMRVIFERVQSTYMDTSDLIVIVHDPTFRAKIQERMMKAARLLLKAEREAILGNPEIFDNSDRFDSRQ